MDSKNAFDAERWEKRSYGGQLERGEYAHILSALINTDRLMTAINPISGR